MNDWHTYKQFLSSNFFMYSMNLISTVKPYKHNICAVIWHNLNLYVYINID